MWQLELSNLDESMDSVVVDDDNKEDVQTKYYLHLGGRSRIELG